MIGEKPRGFQNGKNYVTNKLFLHFELVDNYNILGGKLLTDELLGIHFEGYCK